MIRLVPLTFLLACAPDVRDQDGDGAPDVAAQDTAADTGGGDDTASDSGADTGEQPSRVESEDAGDGTTLVTVDATDSEEWVHFAFATATEVGGQEAWTLALRRFTVKVDGGVSGDGGVEVATLDGQDFDTLTVAPAAGYATDTADALVFDTWYDYDENTHALTAADRVFVVREADGDHFKVAFLDYYDEAGNSGHPRFRWAAVGAP